ncbi:restriction endonuclease subunit S [Lacrimispora sp. NSJ-141]|uniref:Restriction endonuclease subunit S n=1 Tax=Lientehia hominis TaxID=2897778 RepID=A0AAP2W8Q9_9FIRM|nr:restriction endonuclease subunit S [Lientehia hominis]MCD2492475.1 restriction endonuclease subunit S [Lientehia hominis]
MEPMLRFKADNGPDFPDWEEKTLGKVFTEIKEKNHPELPVLSVQQGVGTVLRDSSERRITYDKGNLKNYKAMKKGDFIIHLRSFEGGLECSNHDGISSPAYRILRPNVLISDAFRDYFRSYAFIEGKLSESVVGIRDGKNIDMPTFWEIQIAVPSLPEQRKIADLLSTVDRVIAGQQSEVAAWEQRKKGVMQKLFSQEVRFKADDGSDFPDWEEKTLGELGRFYSGTGFSEKYQGYVDKPVDVYKVSDMNIPANYREMTVANNTVDEDILRLMGTKAITVPCIVFAKVGAAIFSERKRMARKPFVIDNNMMAFAPSEKYDFEFIFWLVQTLMFSRYAQVGALPSYNASDIGILHVVIPANLDEQRKIADCLSSFDEVISKAKAELAKWQELKKGLLQQMFV